MATRRGWVPRHRFTWAHLGQATRSAALAIVMPIIILGGIMFGVFTPTEAGAVAVAYGFLVAAFVYRSITLKGIYRVLVESSILSAVVMIIVSTSMALAWVLSHERVPQALTAWFTTLSRDPTVTLILFTLLLILAGCFLHGVPILLIIIPILLPVVKALGIDLIHFGIIVTFTIAIGQQTPPVGSTLFVVSALSGCDIMSVTRANIPFILSMIVVMYLILFFPQIALILPRLFATG